MKKKQKILELLSFHMNSINIQWFSEQDVNNIKYNLDFGYTIASNTSENNLYRLVLTCKFNSSKPKAGFKIEATITGYFSTPDANDEKKNLNLVCYNGGMILIGTLRGIIANMTGTFPGGKIDLPSINMNELIEYVEKKRQKAVTK